jgi:hypothetical protein
VSDPGIEIAKEAAKATAAGNREAVCADQPYRIAQKKATAYLVDIPLRRIIAQRGRAVEVVTTSDGAIARPFGDHGVA